MFTGTFHFQCSRALLRSPITLKKLSCSRAVSKVHGHFFWKCSRALLRFTGTFSWKMFTGTFLIHGHFFDFSRALSGFTGTLSKNIHGHFPSIHGHFHVKGHFFDVYGKTITLLRGIKPHYRSEGPRQGSYAVFLGCLYNFIFFQKYFSSMSIRKILVSHIL